MRAIRTTCDALEAACADDLVAAIRTWRHREDMGHPWEALLIRLMMRYENLYLSNSANLARYIDSTIIRFMDSSRGRQKLIFASDEPLIPIARALDDARALDMSAEAMDAFLGGNASRIFRITELTTEANR
ncbi:MAG: amidohydrolase family protein [Acidimicrobiia bacterium]|nr:amidohydrolase family protein [Acidimicrobiia bacterium]